MADILFSKSNGGTGDFEIGKIVQDGRIANDFGNVLLPLGLAPRVLTTVEELLYPELTAVLSIRAAFTKKPSVSSTRLNSGTSYKARQYAVTADGNIILHDVNDYQLYRYDRVSDTTTTLYGGVGGSAIKSIACSADGSVIAFITYIPGGVHKAVVSTNSGATFSDVYTAVSASDILDLASIHVSPDGSMIAATLPTNSNGIQYIRIDDPVSSLTLDINLDISVSLVGIAESGSSCASFSDDGTAFVISYASVTGADEYISEYTEDSGATFTRINAFPFDQVIQNATDLEWNIVLDSTNPERLLAVMGNVSEMQGVWYSPNKGLGWVSIPSPDNTYVSDSNDVTTGGGWKPASLYIPQFRNGYCLLASSKGVYYVCYISPTGDFEILDKVLAGRNSGNNKFAIGWAEDNLSFSVAGTAGTNEYPATGGVMTLGKFLPATPIHSNSKIVADAP